MKIERVVRLKSNDSLSSSSSSSENTLECKGDARITRSSPPILFASVIRKRNERVQFEERKERGGGGTLFFFLELNANSMLTAANFIQESNFYICKIERAAIKRD